MLQLCASLSALALRDRILVLLDEVLSRAECLVAGAGNNRNQEGRLVIKPGEDAVGVPVSVGGDGVALGGTVDGDQEDVRFGEGEDKVFAGGWCHILCISLFCVNCYDIPRSMLVIDICYDVCGDAMELPSLGKYTT